MALDPKERERILQEAEYNVFAFPAGLVICDYLSDSGTSAMTDVQWAACKHTFHLFPTLRLRDQRFLPPHAGLRTITGAEGLGFH
jgi:hypothetical protein